MRKGQKWGKKDKVSSEVDVTQTKNYLASVGNVCANVQYAIEIIIILFGTINLGICRMQNTPES